jgi:hypothetical protein
VTIPEAEFVKPVQNVPKDEEGTRKSLHKITKC